MFLDALDARSHTEQKKAAPVSMIALQVSSGVKHESLQVHVTELPLELDWCYL